MKKTIAILLLCGIIFQIFSNAFIIAGFEVNKKYIAEKLCVNKDKPKMQCNGHCQLKKKLDQEEKNQNSAPVNQKEGFEISFCNSIESAKFYNTDLILVLFTFYNSTLHNQSVQPVFHPPCC